MELANISLIEEQRAVLAQLQKTVLEWQGKVRNRGFIKGISPYGMGNLNIWKGN